MKSRAAQYVIIVLLMIALGGIWVFNTLNTQEPAQTFPATVNRDCAPWDGSAFTVSIPTSQGATIAISIYQAPDLAFPRTYSFPDETMRIGNALLLLPKGSPEELSGKVRFWRVEQGKPVEGEFDLYTEAGQQFKGKFKAEWEDIAAYCG
jgi:hypothetical protein